MEAKCIECVAPATQFLEFDYLHFCDTCAIKRLGQIVERLSQAYVTATVELIVPEG